MAHYKGAASEAGRAMHLMKKREKAQQEIEFRKKKIEEDLKISNIENKFAAHYDAVEQQLKVNIIWNYINIMFNIVHYVAALDIYKI
jgi:protein FAM50